MIRRFLSLKRERRHNRRYDAAGAALICGNHRFPLIELSLSGLRARHTPHMYQTGQRVAFTLDLPMPLRNLSVHGEAVVARVQGDEIALRYAHLDLGLMRLLAFFLGTRTPFAHPNR